MRLPQRELHQQLRGELTEARERIAAVVRPLDPSQLHEHPEPEGWSVGQVLEHLIRADELYDPIFASAMRTARPDAGAPAREWKPSFIGKLIANGLLNPKPLNAPRVFLPAPTPRAGVVEALLTRETNFVKKMDDATTYDWRDVRVRSPALWSWAPRMNLGDGFRIHVVHLMRHSRQIERVAGQL